MAHAIDKVVGSRPCSADRRNYKMEASTFKATKSAALTISMGKHPHSTTKREISYSGSLHHSNKACGYNASPPQGECHLTTKIPGAGADKDQQHEHKHSPQTITLRQSVSRYAHACFALRHIYSSQVLHPYSKRVFTNNPTQQNRGL